MLSCLLVTPDTAVRDTVKVGLEQTQTFAVDTVADAWCLEMCKNTLYDVVIVECTFQDGTDGIALAGKIRSMNPDAELLLITRTRTQSRYLTREKQQLGVYGFIHVPVEPLEFFRTIVRLLERMTQEAA